MARLDVAKRHPLQPEVTVLDHNVGGAGGFCAGIARALADAALTLPYWQRRFCATAPIAPDDNNSQQANHYVWLMDDDTIPTPTALGAAACRRWRGPRAQWRLACRPGFEGAVDRRPRASDEQAAPAHLARIGRCESAAIGRGIPGPFAVVRLLPHQRAHDRIRPRLPRAAYFLWNDDYEYTTKLLRHATGYYVPESLVVHKTKVFGSSDADPGERFFFEVRNKLWILRFSRGNFTAAEYAELLLKTLRRWVLTYWRSANRAVILDCFKRGLREGLGQRPAGNAELLAGNPDIVAAIGAVEG
jgi:hypothetical protein